MASAGLYHPLQSSLMGPDMDGFLYGQARTDAALCEGPAALSQCSQYLEPILRDLGLKHWELAGGDAVAVVNRLYELVQLHQKLQEAQDQAQDELHRAKVDAKAASKTIQRLQGQVESKDQELGALNIKLRQLESWYRGETERWASERDELCKKCSQLEQRHTQWHHELRRRDGEFERLQKHLAGQLAASERRRRVSGSGSNSGSSSTAVASAGSGGSKSCRSSSSSSRRGSSSAGGALVETKRLSKAEVEDLYKRSVEVFEAEKQGLEGDNAALRNALHSLEREHKELLNKTYTATRSSGAGSNISSSGSECKASTKASNCSTATMAAGTSGNGSSSDGEECTAAAAATGAAAAAADPAAALHRMHNNLQALKVRKQRVPGGRPLSELQQQAESASERLLLAKLQEAGRIMEEQETALALALNAISSSKSS